MTLDLFNSGYSWQTSKPAFDDVTPGRISNEEMIYRAVVKLKTTCLLQISEITGIEQGRVSARINSLIQAGKVKYSGKEDYLFYKGRIRKKIVLL